MHPAILFEEVPFSVQTTYGSILIIFFVLTILSWFLARKDWGEEDAISIENNPKQEEAEIRVE